MDGHWGHESEEHHPEGVHWARRKRMEDRESPEKWQYLSIICLLSPKKPYLLLSLCKMIRLAQWSFPKLAVSVTLNAFILCQCSISTFGNTSCRHRVSQEGKNLCSLYFHIISSRGEKTSQMLEFKRVNHWIFIFWLWKECILIIKEITKCKNPVT